ncbi:Glutathione S-transferase family protein [Candidatus Hepatincolaceae symbiont of Richtersius coronifer]
MLQLFYGRSPVSEKIIIMLEEIGLPYEKFPINLTAKAHRASMSYMKAVPTGKVPVIIDEGKVVFESGAILLYLAEKSNKLFHLSSRRDLLSWLFWGTAELGVHFLNHYLANIRYPDNKQLIIDYEQHVEDRLYIMEDALKSQTILGKSFICGEYSIVDINVYPLIQTIRHTQGLKILEDHNLKSKLPHIFAWLEQIFKRPAVVKAAKEMASFDMEYIASEEEIKNFIKRIE